MSFSATTRVLLLRMRTGHAIWRRAKSSMVAMARGQSPPPDNKTGSGGTGITIQTNYRRVTPVFRRALEFEERVAVRDIHGEYTYGSLLTAAKKLADDLTGRLQGRTQERVVIVFPNDASYVIALWACWISGQIAVPIRGSHTDTMLEYFVTDCDSNLILSSPQFESPLKETATKVGCKLHVLTDQQRKEAMKPPDSLVNVKANGDNRTSPRRVKCEESSPATFKEEEIGRDPDFYSDSDALIVYTAGTTGTPKGAVLSYSNLDAQVKSMVESWAWHSRDCLLHILPLDHIHGIVDALLSPLSVGARCVMMKEFDPSEVWTELTGVQKSAVDRVNILMGVPWMYNRLVDQFDASLTKSERLMDYIRATCLQKIRLMTCGCFPLPKRLFERWEEITGHQLLERYSVMETGVIFSNPLHGARFHGMVGMPMPRVYVRIVSETDGGVLAEGSSIGTRILSPISKRLPGGHGQNVPATTGLLQVRGDCVFRQYWRKPNATTREFTPDGWFKTGDMVQYKGMYKLLGKAATDVVKSGGFLVSALQVEMVLMDHESVAEAVVVGIQDPTWNQKLAALVVKKEGRKLSEEDVKSWARDRLPEYSVPSVVRLVESIPRNTMGKVNKFQVAAKFFDQPDRSPVHHRKAKNRTKTKTK